MTPPQHAVASALAAKLLLFSTDPLLPVVTTCAWQDVVLLLTPAGN